MKSKLMKKITMSYKENPLHTECKGDSQYRGRKINCVMRCSRLNSSVGDRPAPRGGTTRPDERKITTI